MTDWECRARSQGLDDSGVRLRTKHESPGAKHSNRGTKALQLDEQPEEMGIVTNVQRQAVS